MALGERCALRGREGEIVRGKQDMGTEKPRHGQADWKGREREVDQGEAGGHSHRSCVRTHPGTRMFTVMHTLSHIWPWAHSVTHTHPCTHTATHTQSHTHSPTHQGQARKEAGRHRDCLSSQKGPSHSPDPRWLPEAPQKSPVPADPLCPLNLTAVGLPFTCCATISKSRKSPGLLQRIALRGQGLTCGSPRLPGIRAAEPLSPPPPASPSVSCCPHSPLLSWLSQ